MSLGTLYQQNSLSNSQLMSPDSVQIDKLEVIRDEKHINTYFKKQSIDNSTLQLSDIKNQ